MYMAMYALPFSPCMLLYTSRFTIRGRADFAVDSFDSNLTQGAHMQRLASTTLDLGEPAQPRP